MNHVDPELLAAWADDTLSSEESRAVESHLADCAACRKMAAVFGRTLDSELLTAGSADRGMSLAARGTVAAPSHSREGHTALRAAGKWVLPFAAVLIVGASLAWKYWPRPEVAAPPQIAAATPTPPVAAPEPAPQAPPAKAPKTSVVKPAKPVERARVPGGVAGAPPSQFSTTQALPVATPPPPRPAPAPAAPPPPAQMPPASDKALLDTKRLNVSVQSAEAVRVTGGRGGAAPVVTIASTPPVRWRVAPNNLISRSLDDGATWTTVPLEAASVSLVSGSAPNANVCWLIGRMGAVFLSKNGEPFKPVAFPEPVDLTSILAMDDLRATIITADGRAFRTEDGGQTWRIARF